MCGRFLCRGWFGFLCLVETVILCKQKLQVSENGALAPCMFARNGVRAFQGPSSRVGRTTNSLCYYGCCSGWEFVVVLWLASMLCGVGLSGVTVGLSILM